MSKNWNGPFGPVSIKSDQGQTWAFGAIADAAVFVRNNRLEMTEHPLPGREEGGWKGYFGTRHVLVDECGLIIPLWRIEREIEALPPRPLPSWYSRDYDHERDFRKRPVPLTGGARRYGRYLRHMKTHQEVRENVGLEADMSDIEDFPVRVKMRRRRKNLPTLWDEVAFSRRGDGWKNYRKTQYKN